MPDKCKTEVGESPHSTACMGLRPQLALEMGVRGSSLKTNSLECGHLDVVNPRCRVSF